MAAPTLSEVCGRLKKAPPTTIVTALAVAVWWADRLQWSEEIADRMLPQEDDYDWGQGRSPVDGY